MHWRMDHGLNDVMGESEVNCFELLCFDWCVVKDGGGVLVSFTQRS